MNYEIQTRHMTDSGNGISIEVDIDGTAMSHTFAKGEGWLEKTWDQNFGGTYPKYIKWFVKEYEKRYKDDLGTQTNSKTSEEKLIEDKVFVNDRFKTGTDKNINNDYNQEDNTGENVDLDKPDTIRKYLKDNMAEGYLSKDEEEYIDKFVDRYTEMMSESGKNYDNKEAIQKLLRKVYEGKVQ